MPRMMQYSDSRNRRFPTVHEFDSKFCLIAGCEEVEVVEEDASQKYSWVDEVNVLAEECYKIASDHGWWDRPRSFGDIIANIHDEASEAFRAFAKGNDDHVPEEIADVIIRCLDLSAQRGWNIGEVIADKMTVNKDRSYRHGDKRV